MNLKKANIAILIVHGGKKPSAGQWIDFCLKQIKQFTKRSDYIIFLWANKNNIDLPIVKEFIEEKKLLKFEAHPFEELPHKHAVPLERIFQATKPYSPTYIITLDSDAFPIKSGWLNFLISKTTDKRPLCGIWRDELKSGIPPYIHPSCLCVQVSFLEKINYRFDDILEDTKQGFPRDTISSLTERVVKSDLGFTKLKRSNKINFHPIIGGIYGGYIFHNGAGSRKNISFWGEGEKQIDLISHDVLKEASAMAIQHNTVDYLSWLLGEKQDFKSLFYNIVKKQKYNEKKTDWIEKGKKRLSKIRNKLFSSNSSPSQMDEMFLLNQLIPIPQGWHQTKPSFIGIGVPKAGTSWFFHLLSKHPQVVPHRVLKKNKEIAKELYFFNHNFFEPIQKNEINHYNSAFIGLPNTICGEFSTAYLHHPGVINSLKKAAPDAKLIIILRNPIHRIYSHLNHLLRNRAPKLRLTDNPALLKFYYKHDLIHFAVRHSLYSEALIQLFDTFPQGQVKIILYEELKKHTLETMQSIYHFLGIYPNFKLPDVNKKINRQDYIIPAFTQGQINELVSVFSKDVNTLNRLLPQLKVLEHWGEFNEK